MTERIYFGSLSEQTIVDFIEKSINDYKGTGDVSSNWISEKLIIKYKLSNAVSTVARVVCALRKSQIDEPPRGQDKIKRTESDDLSEKTIKIIAEETTPYQVYADCYHIKSKHGDINISVERVDEIFYKYSRHGMNMSQAVLIREYGLEAWEWVALKDKLQLYKESNVFSPYTVQNTPPDQLKEMIEKKLDKVFKSVGLNIERAYEKKLHQQYKKTINDSEEKKIILESVLMELADKLPNIKFETKTKTNYNISKKRNENIRELNVFLFDPHFGADNFDVATPKYVKKYNPQVTVELFDRIAAITNTYEAEKVNIWFGGDNIHSYTGFNHPGTWKGMAPGLYGANLVIEAYKVFGSFLSKINNLNTVYAVPGNHDRASGKWFEDSGSITKILFEFIKLSISDPNVNIKFDDKILSDSIDGIQYILGHGHLKFFKKNPERLVREFGDPYKFNLIVTGHLHTRIVNFDAPNTRKLTCPSIFAGDEYAQDSGYDSTQGFLVAYNDGNSSGIPVVVDHPL